MTPQRVFAIGFKEWVELRAAHQPPKAFTTGFEKPVKLIIHDGWDANFDPRHRTATGKLTMKVTSHIGGRVLCTLKRRKFVALTRMTGVGSGKMKELPLQLALVFLNRKWRGQHAER